MSDTVIKVENLSKRYRLGQYEKEDTFAGQLKNTLLYPILNFRRIGRLNKFKDDENDPSVFWALRDINFEVKRGEVLGIIGKNGAGKSTLLKLLSNITEPTTGRIEMKGRVSALLEVGTGFHPELTGRDNVYMNGTILGMTRREINAKFEEIVEFAGVAKHIDTPVKFYSSGMKVRLGFSVAAHLEPEILIIDEVLAVGDFEFQRKCLGKMDEVANSGRTVLFVSHNMGSVQALCSQTMFLQSGGIVKLGNTGDVINHYLSDYNTDSGDSIEARKERSGNGKVRFTDFWIENTEEEPIKFILTGSSFTFVFKIKGMEDAVEVDVGFSLHNFLDLTLSVLYSSYQNKIFSLKNGESRLVKVTIPECYFAQGVYTIKGRIIAAKEEADWPKFSIGTLNVEGGNYFGVGSKGFEGNTTVLIKGEWN